MPNSLVDLSYQGAYTAASSPLKIYHIKQVQYKVISQK